MLYVSCIAAAVVALLALYSGYFRSGSYLLIRAGAAALSYLIPDALWEAQVCLWWLPSISLGAASAGARGALPALAFLALTLTGALEGNAILGSLGALYAGCFACLVWDARRGARPLRGPDDIIMLVCLIGGGTSLACGVLWGWDVTLYTSLLCQILIGGCLWYRPELVESAPDSR